MYERAQFKSMLPRYYEKAYEAWADEADQLPSEAAARRYLSATPQRGWNRAAFLPTLYRIGDMLKDAMEEWAAGDGGGGDGVDAFVALAPKESTGPLADSPPHRPQYLLATHAEPGEAGRLWTETLWENIRLACESFTAAGKGEIVEYDDTPPTEEAMKRLCVMKHHVDPGNALGAHRNIVPCAPDAGSRGGEL